MIDFLFMLPLLVPMFLGVVIITVYMLDQFLNNRIKHKLIKKFDERFNAKE